ncbi:MAG: sulfur carrier protein ThiS [Pseudomonadota bacterium]
MITDKLPTLAQEMCSIHLNGQSTRFKKGSSISDVITAQELQGRRIAVEVNGEIIPKSLHDAHQLKANDRVEIVTAVGGG